VLPIRIEPCTKIRIRIPNPQPEKLKCPAKKTNEEITCFEEPVILFWRTNSFASYGAKKYPTSLRDYKEK
jgi:hypothetical protein